MRTVIGLVRPQSGRIRFGDMDLVAVAAYKRAHLGVGYIPEDRRLVPQLSVEENILLPVWATGDAGFEERLAWIYQLMPEVARFATREALQLSGGQQKLAALARALMCGTKLLPLDEPFEGVATGAGAPARRGAERPERRRPLGVAVGIGLHSFGRISWTTCSSSNGGRYRRSMRGTSN